MVERVNRSAAKSKRRIRGLPLTFKFIYSRWFARIYAILALLILFGSTVTWSLLSANLHSSNADQLVNSYLFEHADTFHHASLPGQHSLLVKWPLFYLVKIFGYSNGAFVTFTVITVLITVAVLALIIYRIERRPLLFGTVCLALASTLMLVPAVPYAGALPAI
jgi:hypothetical protein